MNLNKLTTNIKSWAEDRGLDEAQPEKQMLKLMEEVGELAQGLAKGNRDQIIDSVGDVYVVLTILSMQMDLDIEDCIAAAYGEISGRKGKMINGVFVKESDL
ncbi:ArpR [Virgibacillus sp. CM-4]|uniref:MazG-like family protein n=1 Tax=Virgibacillus sp. CM-4 TaxID=1354277 RepID=UPI00038883FD|nr:MazG-like family protein [Virgibacillus sp. CM-4]EQB34882.1 ArpR [Virgibacillus sp. CM-4]